MIRAKPKQLTLLGQLRQAVADYMWSEGCSCCRSSNHGENSARLAKLLRVPKYPDGSGHDWSRFRTPKNTGESK